MYSARSVVVQTLVSSIKVGTFREAVLIAKQEGLVVALLGIIVGLRVANMNLTLGHDRDAQAQRPGRYLPAG